MVGGKHGLVWDFTFFQVNLSKYLVIIKQDKGNDSTTLIYIL